MSQKISQHTWVYVVVIDPEKTEQILGLEDNESGIQFIPAFMDRETAQQNLYDLPRQKGKKHEIQAIIYEDLVRHAQENQCLIFILDDNGNITHKIDPAAQ